MVILKGLTLQNGCMMLVCVCFMFVSGLVWEIDLRKGLFVRKVLKCAFAYGTV